MNWRSIHTIAEKEFQSYFNSPLGVIFLAAFWLITTWIFFQDFFFVGQSTLRPFFEALPWVYLFFLPAITMRLWAEERKLGTLEVLLTSPLTPLQAVLGKALASFWLLLFTLFLSLFLPLLLWFIGSPDWGAIAAGYLGAVLLGASYLAIGLFISSLTDNQITAFLISVLVLVFLLALGNGFVLRALPLSAVPWATTLSLDSHFKSLLRGVLDSRDLIYYASFLFIFLYLNVLHLKHRQWK